MATLGNAQDFGDLTVSRDSGGDGTSSSTRGIFVAGRAVPAPAPVGTDVIDYVSILTTGNAIDFGNISSSLEQVATASNGHGGL